MRNIKFKKKSRLESESPKEQPIDPLAPKLHSVYALLNDMFNVNSFDESDYMAILFNKKSLTCEIIKGDQIYKHIVLRKKRGE
jgi:hypothetical protein|nr:MAG TPA: hypothetical protein [Caudoviricetes sp.]